MANYGFVYVLSNSCMPGIYKIGYTDRSPLARAEEISNSTACPMPFEIVIYGETEDPRLVEQQFHVMYEEDRINPQREFFRFDKEKLIREVCINLAEQCQHMTYCSTYYEMEYEVKQEG